MRKVLFFILTIIISAGCTTHQSADDSLIEIERHFADSPEVSIEMLYGLEKDKRVWKNEHDEALYCLLYIETIHRLGLFTRSDSIINIAWKYYDKEGTDEEKARTYLCKGIIYHDMKRYAEAVQCLKQAEEYAEESKNGDLKYRINDRLGLINKEKDCIELSLKHYRKALTAASEQNNAAYHAAVLNHIAEAFHSDGMQDSALAYTRKSLPLINQFRNYTSEEKCTKSDVLASLAQYYIDRYRYDDAKKILDTAKDLNLSTKVSLLYGDYYAAMGNEKEAEKYWKDALSPQDMDNSIKAYKSLIALSTAQGRDSEALSLSRELNDILTDRQEAISPAEFIGIQNNYDAMVADKKAYHQINILFSIIICLTAIILLLVYITRRKTEIKSNEYEREIQQIDIPKDNTARVICSEITERMHKLATSGKQAEPHDWTELTRIMTEEAPLFMEKITHKNVLNHREIRITILTRLRFAPSEIAALTHTSAQTVTNSRAQLLSKIFGMKGGARDFDKRIIEE